MKNQLLGGLGGRDKKRDKGDKIFYFAEKCDRIRQGIFLSARTSPRERASAAYARLSARFYSREIHSRGWTMIDEAGAESAGMSMFSPRRTPVRPTN